MSKQYVMKNGIAVEVSDDIYEILKKTDRLIKYVERDLKETRYIIDQEKANVKEIPSRQLFFAFFSCFGVDIICFPLAISVSRTVSSLVWVVVYHHSQATCVFSHIFKVLFMHLDKNLKIV